MEQSQERCAVLLATTAALIFAPAARASEVQYDHIICANQKVITIEATADAYANSHEQWAIVAKSNTKDWENGTQHCGGYWRVANGKDSGGGVCKWVFPSGDTILGEWKGTGPGEGTWTFLSGTGKFKGIQGSGQWKVLSTTAKAVTEDSYQACERTWGKYTLPES